MDKQATEMSDIGEAGSALVKASENQNQVDIQVHNALHILASRHSYLSRRDNVIKSISTYSPEEGKVYSTSERAIPDVVPPTSVIPSDEELFDAEGIPDYKLLMRHFKRQGRIEEHQMIKIIDTASEIMKNESNILELGIPTTVVGDIHGQYYDLLGLLELYGDPKDTQYLFLGDYVDRGDRSIEVLILLYAIKINFPKSFWLLRGNHESSRMTSYFTFKKECVTRFSINLYKKSLDSFKTLPLCAVLNRQFFCVHAGISSELLELDAIKTINRFVEDFPSSGLFCDLMWSDPSPQYDDENISIIDVDEYFKRNTDRHCSEFYSYRATEAFLNCNNLLSVIRGHQPQDSGYRIYKMNKATNFPSLITIFSAPNYCGTYGNMAAVLHYNGETFNIKQFDSFPTPYFLPDQMNVFAWSLPFVAEKVVEILSAVLNVCTEDELFTESLMLNQKNYEAIQTHYKNKAVALGTPQVDLREYNPDDGTENVAQDRVAVKEVYSEEEPVDSETESDEYLQTTSESEEDDSLSESDTGSYKTGVDSLGKAGPDENEDTSVTSLVADKTENNSSDVTDVEETQVEVNPIRGAPSLPKNTETANTLEEIKYSPTNEHLSEKDAKTHIMEHTKNAAAISDLDNIADLLEHMTSDKMEVKKLSRRLKEKTKYVDSACDTEKSAESKRRILRSHVRRIPHHLNKIQRKVGVGKRMSQLLQVLREEREKVEEFAQANKDLPAQVLLDGREALANTLKDFTEASELDKPNEGLPPDDWRC